MIVAVVIMIPALAIVAFFVGHHAGVNVGRFDERFKAQRADGLFAACDLELNALKGKYSQALMQIEDLKKDR